MDEVITRISEHEGGAIHCCHHRANSWRLKPLQQLGDYTHTHTHMHRVHKNYPHLYWKQTSGLCCDNQWLSRQTPSLFLFNPVYTTNPTVAKHHTVIKAVWERDLPRLLPLSCWCPRLTTSATHTWKIETLMELLLCSFPNGEKFNYQLICWWHEVPHSVVFH